MNGRRMFSATYRDGVFVPDESCDLPEGTRVTVKEGKYGVLPPMEPDPVKRRELRRKPVKEMTENPLLAGIDPNTPRLTREQMHERRP